MLLVWAGLVALVVWGIARRFPDRPSRTEPTASQHRPPEDASPSLTESGRH